MEDQPPFLELLRRCWRVENVSNRIHVFQDGGAATVFLLGGGTEAMQGGGEARTAALLDLKVPKFDGLETLRRLKADPRITTLPVVVVTSPRGLHGVVEDGQMGVNSFLVKPVKADRFAEAIQQLGMYWLLLNEAPRLLEGGAVPGSGQL